MPTRVKAARVLMFVVAGITLLMTLAFVVAEGVTAAALGAALWPAFPGVLSLVLALRVPDGGIRLWRGIVALEIFFIVLSLARIGQGDPRGLANLIFPIVILALILNRDAKRHFSTAAPRY